MMSVNEKLTIQALKDHDKVQPKFSSTSLPKSSSRDGSKVSVSSRRSHPSGDQASTRSNKNGRPPPKINFFKFVVATRAWHRLAQNRRTSRIEKVKPVVKFENTYRTEPDKGKIFAPARVEGVLKDTLERRLKTVKYTPEGSRIIATELTADIKSKVKAMDFPRYKIVCSVIITENKRQGLEIASRSIWNADTDNFASYTYRNPTLIAVANVYGVYFE